MRQLLAAALISLAGPALAEGTAGASPCNALWAGVANLFMATGAAEVTGTIVDLGPERCEVTDVVIDNEGDYAPDWHLDRVELAGSALSWLADLIGGGNGAGLLPGTLRVDASGFRIVVQTGNTQMDWLFEAQSRPNKIDGSFQLGWNDAAKELRLERLVIDFPGDNLVEASALVRNVDLASEGAMEMSLTSFAMTEADLKITTHGLFEWYVLMTLAPRYLPSEGDMDAAMAGMKADATAALADLPATTFSPESKAALAVLIAELPNPAGELTVALRSEAGIGPARIGGYAVTGVPGTVAETAPVLDGVTIDVGWVHSDAE